ncbi:MAG: hypothetical protein VR64_20345 [Desulfatitalea sp. BRH_c12]|nr:MAG: hypothetical protein VR64_20345 [Desulfatitalea sp. BRH_c12]
MAAISFFWALLTRSQSIDLDRRDLYENLLYEDGIWVELDDLINTEHGASHGMQIITTIGDHTANSYNAVKLIIHIIHRGSYRVNQHWRVSMHFPQF